MTHRAAAQPADVDRTRGSGAETPLRLLVIGPHAFADAVNDPVVARMMAAQLADRLRRAQTPTAS